MRGEIQNAPVLRAARFEGQMPAPRETAEQRVKRAIAELSKRERRVLRRWMRGMTHKEIGREIGMAQSTVNVWVHSIQEVFTAHGVPLKRKIDLSLEQRKLLGAAGGAAKRKAAMARRDELVTAMRKAGGDWSGARVAEFMNLSRAAVYANLRSLVRDKVLEYTGSGWRCIDREVAA